MKKKKPKKYRRCRVCSRELTSNRSQLLGVGPGCKKKHAGLLYHEMLEANGQMRLFD